MNLIPNDLLNAYNGTTFSVGVTHTTYHFRDHSYYTQPLLNTTEYVDFCKELNNLSYNSILIGGLGLGYIPYWISQNTSCSIIDVIDNNSELISWTNSNGHLTSSINLIENDIYSYSPTDTYDLILIDIWWGTPSENIDTNEPLLINHLSGSVNQNGSIYFPLSQTVWTNN